MGEGWENARRRDGGNDHVTVALAAPGLVRRIEVDTSYFVGNAAGWARLSGVNEATGDVDDPSTWEELVPKTRLQPDTRHFFRVRPDAPVTHVRLDVFPDGGLARLRINGEVDEAALHAAVVRWLDLLPESHAVQVLTPVGGCRPRRPRRWSASARSARARSPTRSWRRSSTADRAQPTCLSSCGDPPRRLAMRCGLLRADRRERARSDTTATLRRARPDAS